MLNFRGVMFDATRLIRSTGWDSCSMTGMNPPALPACLVKWGLMRIACLYFAFAYIV